MEVLVQSSSIISLKFEILEIRNEEIKNYLGKNEITEILLCKVTIRGESKEIKFLKLGLGLYESKEHVYVQIPQGWSGRGLLNENSHNYLNKVRKANSYIQKIDNVYVFLTQYSVLKGTGIIRSWVNSEENLFSKFESYDSVVPEVIMVDTESDWKNSIES